MSRTGSPTSMLRVIRSILLLLVLSASAYENAGGLETSRVHRIGVLYVALSPGSFDDGLREGLRESGYTEGDNISIEWRRAADPDQALRTLSGELVAANVEIIVAAGNAASRAALEASSHVQSSMRS